MTKKRARYLGETRRLTVRLVSFSHQGEVHIPVMTDYLEHAGDDAIVHELLLPALHALKREAGIGRRPATRKRKRA